MQLIPLVPSPLGGGSGVGVNSQQQIMLPLSADCRHEPIVPHPLRHAGRRHHYTISKWRPAQPVIPKITGDRCPPAYRKVTGESSARLVILTQAGIHVSPGLWVDFRMPRWVLMLFLGSRGLDLISQSERFEVRAAPVFAGVADALAACSIGRATGMSRAC